MLSKLLKYFKLYSATVCSCCGGSGTYDEGYGEEECSCCSGTGYED